METIISILILTTLISNNGNIENFLNSSHIYSMFHNENLIYCATSGGAAIFDTSTGSFDRIFTGKGLAKNDVRDIILDKYGNIWFLCYGKGISILSPNNIWKEVSGEWYEIPESVFCINILSDTVLVGTHDGIRLWDIKNTNPMEKTDKMEKISTYPGNFVKNIIFLNDTLYICTDEGIGKVTLSNIEHFSEWNTITEIGNVNSVEMLRDTLWIATSGGISYINDGDYHYVASYDSRDFTVWGGKLWVATYNGLRRWNGTGFSFTPIIKELRCFLPLSKLWIGSWGEGILEFNYDTVITHIPEGPGDNRIGDIAVDEAGNLWSINGGCMVSKYNVEEGIWEIFNLNNEWNVQGGGLSALAVAKDSKVWLGVWNWSNEGPALIRLYPDGTLDTLFRLQGNNVISDIAISDSNDVWVSTWKIEGEISRLRRYRRGSIDSIDIFTFPPGINRITFDNQLNTWVGCTYELSGGVYRIINQSEAEELLCPEIQGEEIHSLAFDFEGRIWIGTPAGTYVIRDGIIEYLLTSGDTDVVGDVAQDIICDIHGNIWLLLEPTPGVTEGGLTKVTSNFEFSSITHADGLLPVSIDYSKGKDYLAYDATRGWLWIATSEGISRYDTGITPPSTIFSVLVYPNPFLEDVHTFIKFYSDDLMGGSIRIYSLSGQCIKTFSNINGDTLKWINPVLASGVYIYTAYAGSENKDKTIGKFSVIR